MNSADLASTVAALLAPGKGLLAADESLPTIEKRFRPLGLPSTTENHRLYRELLFTTPGLGQFISGVILFDETIRQQTGGGVPFATYLAQQGMVPGIKVDGGTVALAGFPGEKITEGLDGLRERLADYRKLGARFTKWRAVIEIGAGLPTDGALAANAHTLAQYAALSQEAGLVPIVEPEVLMDGDHALARGEEVLTVTLRQVFAALVEGRVSLEGMLLKTSMGLAGAECAQQPDVAAVTGATLRCFRRTVPAAVPGIVFLSGGQGDKEATERLNAICQVGGAPWKISFSYGRALQAPALAAWRGVAANVPAAQAALLHRARCNGLAVQGKYSPTAEAAQP